MPKIPLQAKVAIGAAAGVAVLVFVARGKGGDGGFWDMLKGMFSGDDGHVPPRDVAPVPSKIICPVDKGHVTAVPSLQGITAGDLLLIGVGTVSGSYYQLVFAEAIGPPKAGSIPVLIRQNSNVPLIDHGLGKSVLVPTNCVWDAIWTSDEERQGSIILCDPANTRQIPAGPVPLDRKWKIKVVNSAIPGDVDELWVQGENFTEYGIIRGTVLTNGKVSGFSMGDSIMFSSDCVVDWI